MKRSLARLVRKAQRALTPQAPLAATEHARNGDLARNSGDWSTALGHYVLAVTARPDLEPIWVQLGHAYKEVGQPAEAEKAYRAALKIDGDNADTWLQLGHLLKWLDRPAEALEAYENALRLEPQNSHAQREIFPLRDHVVRHQSKTPAAMIEKNTARYEDAVISATQPVFFDLTGTQDHGPHILSEMVQQCGRMATAVIWSDRARAWTTLAGAEIADASLARSVFLLSGPWISVSDDYVEALRHLVLHHGTLLVTTFIDQQVFFRPELYPQESLDGAEAFLSMHRTLASGALSAMGTDENRLRELAGRSTSQLGVLPLPSACQSARWLPNGPIVVFGIESSPEGAAMRNALATLGIKFLDRIRPLSEPAFAATDCADIRGAVFLSADPSSLSTATACVAAGIPCAFAQGAGFGRLIDWADAVLPTDVPAALEAGLAVFAKTSALGTRHGSFSDPTPIPCPSLFAGWRRRVVCGPASKSQLAVFGSNAGSPSAFSSTTLFPGAWTADRLKGIRILGDAIDLGHRPQTISGSGETLALLISAPSSAISVKARASGGMPDAVASIAEGALAWLHCPLVAGSSSARLAVRIGRTVSATGSDTDLAILHAVFSYPTGRPDVWWDFLDQIARGKYPSVRQLAHTLLTASRDAND